MLTFFHYTFYKKMSKIIILLSCLYISVYVISIAISKKQSPEKLTQTLLRQNKKNIKNTLLWSTANFRTFNPLKKMHFDALKQIHLSALKKLAQTYLEKKENMKYILLWSHADFRPFSALAEGQESFISRNCPVTNCYVTTDRSLLNDDITNFDVIAFMGRRLEPGKLPKKRSPNQRYVFVTDESSFYYPVTNPVFDGFFNWTATSRLDSDIPIPYVHIKDKNGNKIGPKKNMDWSAVLNDNEDVTDFQFNKTKAAAIFVSECRSKRRERVYKDLNKNLKKYHLSVDVYGHCGKLKCPKEQSYECNKLLEAQYYFYLAFENSFNEDYVTEKLLRPLNFNVVPVVFGGANYSRFLPPRSYLDARFLSSKALAKIMADLIHSPDIYKQYFKWHRHYTYLDQDAGYRESICNICAKVNDPSLLATPKIYHTFRKWWNRQ